VLALCAVALAASPTVAHAAFPGLNGQIGFATGPTSDLFAINFDGRLARSVITRPGVDREPHWSPDGRKIAWNSSASGKSQMYVADADGTNVRRLAPSSGYDYVEGWSPDSRSILFTSGRDGTGTVEIYVAGADGSNVRRLTFRPLEDGSPAWSPDGTTIVWSSRETANEKFHLYAMNADGTNQHRLTTQNSQQESSAAWSPDGRRLIWGSYKSGGEIWIGNADASNARRLYSNPYLVYSPIWSPDGKLIAFTQRHGSGDDKAFEIWVMRADGTGAALVIGIDRSPFGVGIDWQAFADRGAQPTSLLRDGGAEDGFGGYFVGVPYTVPSWETNGGLTALRYGLPGFPTAASQPPVLSPASAAQRPVGGVRPGDEGGKRFFFGGTAAVSTAVQDVDLSNKATEIDTGRASVTLSGLLGGKAQETDEGTAAGTFLDAQGKVLGIVQIGPVTPADRGNASTFVSRLQTATLPAGTRKVRVTLTATRRVGATNDAYFENIALAYAKPTDPPPTAPPAPVAPPAPKPPGIQSGVLSQGIAGLPGAAGAGRITRLSIAPARFAAAKGNTATIAAARAPRGAKIRYTLARAGLVKLTIARRSAGRRVGGRCVAPTRANRTRKRCTRFAAVATLLRNGRRGRNVEAFTGRVFRKALAPGTYRLTAATTNAARVTFRVVRR
jgi:hypothetical protein